MFFEYSWPISRNCRKRRKCKYISRFSCSLFGKVTSLLSPLKISQAAPFRNRRLSRPCLLAFTSSELIVKLWIHGYLPGRLVRHQPVYICIYTDQDWRSFMSLVGFESKIPVFWRCDILCTLYRSATAFGYMDSGAKPHGKSHFLVLDVDERIILK